MIQMFTSASRVVLIIIAMSLCALVFMRIVDPKDFMIIVGMVFAYYFNKPVDKSTDEFVK